MFSIHRHVLQSSYHSPNVWKEKLGLSVSDVSHKVSNTFNSSVNTGLQGAEPERTKFSKSSGFIDLVYLPSSQAICLLQCNNFLKVRYFITYCDGI